MRKEMMRMTEREKVILEIESDPNVLNTNCGLTLVRADARHEVGGGRR